MSVFTSLGILILSMLIVASLKLVPGVFALFYHYASGRYSKKSVDTLSIFFILGVEALPVLLFMAINFILYILPYINVNIFNHIFLYTAIGLLIALSLAFFFFYFRHGRNTNLFIPRKIATNLEQKAYSVKNNSDAFVLGFVSGIPELLFTLPLFFIVFVEISDYFIFALPCALFLMLFIFSIILPLFLTYNYFNNDNNLANIIKLRIKNKTFFRLFVPILYLIIATLILIFKVIYNG